MNNAARVEPRTVKVIQAADGAVAVPEILPISALLPTRDRSEVLHRMLLSLAQQKSQPAEMIIIDASTDNKTEYLCSRGIPGLATKIIYKQAKQVGAAVQRNEAATYATQDNVLFLDDDIIFEPNCLSRLWQALNTDLQLGGVSAMITNQKYGSPGLLSRSLFRILHGNNEESYAGMCIGPAYNLLPEDKSDLPEVMYVDWLNLGCTLYRREVLPKPVFPTHFSGYSLMEDLALSLIVGRTWKLANARTARIFHDSQPGAHKNNMAEIAKMELLNRHYVMTCVMKRRGLSYHLKLSLLELFGIVTTLTSRRAWVSLPAIIRGKLAAIHAILTEGHPA